MKKLLFILVCLPLVGFSKEKEIPSKISKVTVYLSGAEVTRNTILKLQPGTTHLVFNGLSPVIDESSIRFSGLKSSSIVSFNYKVSHILPPKISDQIELLRNKLVEFKLEKSMLNNIITGLEKELDLLNTNKVLWNEKEVSSLEKLKNFSSYYRQRVPEIQNSIYNYQVKIDSLLTDIGKYNIDLEAALSSNKDAQGTLLVKLNSDRIQDLDLKITYNVSNAGWFPVYDLKATDIKSDLNIDYKAHVYQDTGENWEEVNLVLSTADPDINNELPKLEPHFLNFSAPIPHVKAAKRSSHFKYNPFIKKVVGIISDASGPLPGATVVIQGTSHGTTTDFDGRFSLDIPEGSELVVSYIGFKTEQIPIYSSVINISMEEDAQALDELVVTGYGTVSGNVSGVNIKGVSTVKEKHPIYIIDGVVATDEDYDALDPHEIASISNLSNTEASGIYGSRASGGAIVIVTKEVITTRNISSKEFAVRKKHTVNSILDVTVIKINTHSIQVNYEHLAVPVLNENVFLTAAIENWESLDLLPGEANIYFAGSYSGKSFVNPFITDKKMVLSMGVDTGIKVQRKQLNNFKNKSFTGSSKIVERAYKIEIKNNKGEEITLRLLDRIPISQNKEIKVDKIVQESDNYNKEKGIMTWNLKLAPGSTVDKEFSFAVKYPRYKQISL